MTIFDIAFLILFFAAIAVCLIGAFAALLGYRRAAYFTFGGLGAFTVLYIGTWVVVTASGKQAPLTLGDPQCVDNWCIGIEDVKSNLRGSIVSYDVTFCLFSRALRTQTSFGAHKAADQSTDFQLIDDRGRRYSPLPHKSEIPLNTVLDPGQALFTKRASELPADARGIAAVIADGSLGACPMIAECSTSHDASQYVIATGVYRKGSSFLALVRNLKEEARTKPQSWR